MGSLVFSLVSQSNPAVVQVSVTSCGMLSATVQGSAKGSSRAVLAVRDSQGNASQTALEFVVGGAAEIPGKTWQELR